MKVRSLLLALCAGSAMQAAEGAAAKARAASAEFEANVAAARAELYKQMDERRKAAEGYRSELVAQKTL